MPRIAEHCAPGGWRHAAEPYTPAAAWPEDCYVQWGSDGVVLSRSKGSYRTAFFEAFPSEPATFIRGEGATVAEAEAKAFAAFEHYRACAGHEFERRGYTNGAGFCKHCGLFASKAFEPTTLCHVCGTPTNHSCGYTKDAETGARQAFWYCEAHAHLRRANGHTNPLDRLLDEELAEPQHADGAAPGGTPVLSEGVESEGGLTD